MQVYFNLNDKTIDYTKDSNKPQTIIPHTKEEIESLSYEAVQELIKYYINKLLTNYAK